MDARGKCLWVYDVVFDCGNWETQCGEMFEFVTDGPVENKFKFCPYCGGELELTITKEEEGEEEDFAALTEEQEGQA